MAAQVNFEHEIELTAVKMALVLFIGSVCNEASVDRMAETVRQSMLIPKPTPDDFVLVAGQDMSERILRIFEQAQELSRNRTVGA